MSIRLKAPSVLKPARSQGHEQTSRLTPLSFTLLACETCVLNHLKDGWREVVEDDIYGHLRYMRATYPQELMELLVMRQVCDETEASKYQVMEQPLKNLDRLEPVTDSEEAISADLETKLNAAELLNTPADVKKVMKEYSINARIWSLGLALTFLDPKVGEAPKLLTAIRHCQRLKVGDDFKINYAAVLDPELYSDLKSWWDYVEGLGELESRDDGRFELKSKIYKSIRGDVLKCWRRCDIDCNEGLPKTFQSIYEKMHLYQKKFPIKSEDSPHDALVKKYSRGIARHALEDSTATDDILGKYLSADVLGTCQEFFSLRSRPQVASRSVFRTPRHSAPVRLAYFLQQLWEKPLDKQIPKLANEAKSAMRTIVKNRHSSSGVRKIAAFWYNSINEIYHLRQAYYQQTGRPAQVACNA